MERDGFEWDIGLAILSTYDEDGFGSTGVDVPGEQKAQVAPYEKHFTYGIYGRELDPTFDKAGNPDPATANQVLHALEGGIGHSFPLENPSVIKLLPTLKPGETLFYGPKGQIIRTTIDGQMLIWCPAPEGSGQCDFNMSWGSEGVEWAGRFGTFKHTDQGCHVTTTGGASIEMGGVALPGPMSSVGSSVVITAGQIALKGNVTIGAGEAVAPGVNATFLLAKLASYDAALKAIAIALQGGTAGGPAAQQIIGAAPAVAAIAAASVPATPITLYTDSNATYG